MVSVYITSVRCTIVSCIICKIYTLTRITFDILRFLKNQERHPKKESYIDSNFILPIQCSYISIRQIGFRIIFSHKNEDSSLKLISTRVILVRGRISKTTKEKRIYFFSK